MICICWSAFESNTSDLHIVSSFICSSEIREHWSSIFPVRSFRLVIDYILVGYRRVVFSNADIFMATSTFLKKILWAIWFRVMKWNQSHSPWFRNLAEQMKDPKMETEDVRRTIFNVAAQYGLVQGWILTSKRPPKQIPPLRELKQNYGRHGKGRAACEIWLQILGLWLHDTVISCIRWVPVKLRYLEIHGAEYNFGLATSSFCQVCWRILW